MIVKIFTYFSLLFLYTCLRDFIGMKRHHNVGEYYKGKIFNFSYIFWGLGCYYHSATMWLVGRQNSGGAENPI